jgi:DNA-directed RNA polymerase specialized sigma24 family protein
VAQRQHTNRIIDRLRRQNRLAGDRPPDGQVSQDELTQVLLNLPDDLAVIDATDQDGRRQVMLCVAF